LLPQIEAKNAILEHLGRQHQAMVALLADLVNIYSGRYNKRGVDAVGHRLRVWLDAAGISCETFPHEAFGDCLAARLPASGGGNRPIVLMGHRDTVFPTAPLPNGRSASTVTRPLGRVSPI
jgi:glutamate carboxypeptidase